MCWTTVTEGDQHLDTLTMVLCLFHLLEQGYIGGIYVLQLLSVIAQNVRDSCTACSPMLSIFKVRRLGV